MALFNVTIYRPDGGETIATNFTNETEAKAYIYRELDYMYGANSYHRLNDCQYGPSDKPGAQIYAYLELFLTDDQEKEMVSLNECIRDLEQKLIDARRRLRTLLDKE